MERAVWLWGLLVLCGLSGFSWADPLVNVKGKQEFILFDVVKNQRLDATKESGQLVLRGLDRMQSAVAGGLEKFSAKAQLAWVTQQQSMVANALDFILPTDFSQVAQGWAGQGSQYIWRRQSSGPLTPLSLSLTPAIANHPFQFDGYDELWIDYTPTLGVKECGMQVQGILQPRDKKLPAQSLMLPSNLGGGYNDLKVLEILDSSHSALKAKDFFYLLGRVLGLAPDEDWRFIQDQKNTLLQKRMHYKLDNADVLEIAFEAGLRVEQVNLMVSRKDSHGGGEVLEFGGGVGVTLADGRFAIRLDLRKELAKQFPREWEENSKEPGANSFYLKEVFLFFRGDAETVVASKPLPSLSFLEEEEYLPLTGSVLDVNASRKRWVADIREYNYTSDVDVKQANLILYPPKAGGSCMISINDIRAVRNYKDQVPSFAKNLEGWVRSRGGPFVQMLPEHGQVEHPGILNFLPLSTFHLGGGIPDFRVLTEAGKDVALENRWMSTSTGATLAFQGMEPAVSRDGDSLVLEGNSNSLEITWPMATRLFENTWFYFGVMEGAEQMTYMSLSAEFADGHKILRRVEPNKPFRIDSGDALLTKLSLSLELKTKPFRIKLRELAIFSPKIATYGEAQMVPLPFAMNVKLKPSLTEGTQRLIESGQGYATGLLGNEPVRFVTLLDKEVALVQGLNLGFHFPLGLADKGKCPLTMQLNWASGQTLRQFCPKYMKGSIFLPLANLLGAEIQGHNLGTLKSIEWMVAASVSRVGGEQEAFSLNFSVEGWAMVSAIDQVHLSPLIKTGKEDFYTDMTKRENSLSDIYSRRFWLPLETATLDKIGAMKGEILTAKHPLFTLDKIVAEPKQPIDLARWMNLFNPPVLNVSPRWPKLLLWVSVIALVWVAWKKRWWSMVGLSRIFLGIGKVLFGLARIFIQSLCPPLLHQRLLLQWQNRPHHLLLVAWTALTLALYGIGLNMGSVENYFFTFGGMAVVMVMRELFLVVEPRFRRASSNIANYIYSGAGSLYFSGGFLVLVVTATMLSLKLELIAKQLAVVVYYCMVVGTVLEIVALRRAHNDYSDKLDADAHPIEAIIK